MKITKSRDSKITKFPAGVTQLVESQPSKLLVAGSSPVARSSEVEGVHIEELAG